MGSPRWRSAALALAAWTAGACATSPPPQDAEAPARVELLCIDRPGEDGFGTVVVRGLGANAQERYRRLEPGAEVLRLYTGAAPGIDQPALMGRTRLEDGVLVFVPRFPLVAGLEHTARFEGTRLALPDRELVFALPEPDRGRRTEVVAIHPGLERVPANLLRIYVSFSAPMHTRDVLSHIRLLDARGGEVVDPFLDVEHGLWDPDHRRLTLFFHPGRVKRDVAGEEDLGPPLEAGGRYRLEIDGTLEDARGVALGEPVTWSFEAGAADRASPDPARWHLVPPSDATDALEVAFGEPLDQALVGRLLWVEDAGGTSLAGEARVLDGGTGWSFRPTEPWSGAPHALVAHPLLEDLAGNAIGHRFEERMTGDAERDSAQPVRLEFATGR